MNTLPPFVQNWLQDRLQDKQPSSLKNASQELTRRYRSQVSGRQLAGSDTIDAYLAARMPATYAVVSAVLQTLKGTSPDWQPETLLDLGAGPGTASLAAHANFPNLKALTLVEPEPGMLLASQSLFSLRPELQLKSQWLQTFLPGLSSLFSADNATFQGKKPESPSPLNLTLLSYVLNELTMSDRQNLIQELLQLEGVVVAIEPGTPAGYANILQMRKAFLTAGWSIWAPCPHGHACPISSPDWCHFSERLPRNALQRYLKEGYQNFEDEKYTYLILNRQPLLTLAKARILRHPLKHKGHLELSLCTEPGLEKRIISRSQPEYKQARKAAWGDSFP